MSSREPSPEWVSVAADPLRPGLERLVSQPLVILVGLTAVGKTTLVERLCDQRRWSVLPNRRWIADRLILPRMLERNGVAVAPVVDRVDRFRLTAQYRRLHPGGIAEALSSLAVDTSLAAGPYLFDGLRGVDEVQWASRRFASSRFVALDAADRSRLERMLRRSEEFDRTTSTASGRDDLLRRLAAIEGVGEVFSTEELEKLGADAQAAGHTDDEVVEKAAIIVAERRNYDSAAAIHYLRTTLPSERVLTIDSDAIGADGVARRDCDWI